MDGGVADTVPVLTQAVRALVSHETSSWAYVTKEYPLHTDQRINCELTEYSREPPAL